MLIELHIRGYAVLDDVSLRPGPGLNVLTGETGAGKSIIVGALSLLLGERASSDVVRTGEDRAVVEAVFDLEGREDVLARLEEMGYQADEGLLILKREVQAEGRNRAWIGGSPATASSVWELGSALVDLHGQHEHQTLLGREQQRDTLDAYAGLQEEARRLRGLHGRAKDLSVELETRRQRRRELEARADFLRFQLREIDDAAPRSGEEEALEEEARRLEHARELAETSGRLHEALYAGDDALAGRLAEARTALKRLAGYDGSLEEPAVLLEEAYHQVAETGRLLGDYAASVDHDPARLEEIRRRRDLLFRLERKYGPTLDDVLETARRCRAELEELEGADRDVGALEEELAAARDELASASGRLSEARAGAASELSEEVEALLPELGMPGGTFRVTFQPLDEPGPGGSEAVEFRVALNPGFEPRPLSRVASGGELSRVMLALKTILARVDRVPTLVFDEIDAGIGGVVATAVGAKLARVAEHHQVLVVTHLAQLASRARAHLRVEKGRTEGLAATVVVRLEGEERVEEIARMLGGDPGSRRSREHARELLRVG